MKSNGGLSSTKIDMDKPDYHDLSQELAEAHSANECRELVIRDAYEAVETACNLLIEYHEESNSKAKGHLWTGAAQALERALKTLGREIEEHE